VPAVLLGFVTWFYLTDWPGQANWLHAEERDWIVQALELEKASKKAARSYTIWQALRDRDVLVLTAIYFVQVAVSYSFGFWLPTMLKRLSGLPDLQVTWLVAIPSGLGLLAMHLNGWHSDRTGERRWHTALPLLLTAACLLGILVLQPGAVGTFVGYTAVIAILMAFLPSFWPMPTSFLSESAAAACIGTMNCIGLLGGFAGPYLVGLLTLTLRPRKLGKATQG
jgi:MFS transporter, ACS family, tartrate transporter